MGKKNVTISVNKELYDKYVAHCKKNGYVISRKFEIFMEEELERTDVEGKNVKK